MDLIVIGFVAGVVGTLAMDSLNFLFARIGIISKIDVGMIGRMAVGWLHGRYCYRYPDGIERVANETLYGYITHYIIGVGLAIPYVLGWDLLVGNPISPIWAIPYGVFTTIASHFFVLPSMGLGIFGRRSSESIRLAFSALANHLFYGVGIAVGIVLF